MKTLLLMRHAKSSWKHPELGDHERPLNKRGEKDAPRMGELIKEKELYPQRILSSTAVRAHKTTDAVVQKLAYTGQIEFLDTFYLAEPNVYRDMLCALPDELERVLVIGHNPGLEGLLQILTGRVESLPTGALAYLVLSIEKWSDLKENQGELIQLWRPRDLK